MSFKKLRKGAGKYLFEMPKTQAVMGEDKERLVFNYEARVLGHRIIIPKDFVFNGASIPRIFWVTTGCPFRPKYKAASLVHDYLYRIKANRKLADLIYRQLLLDSGVGKYNAGKQYRAVRAFGGRAWKKGE
jgi:hypothetical protein